MIELIKEGTKKQIECPNCGALLRYGLEDVEQTMKMTSPFAGYMQKYIECPQCKVKIILEETR